MPLVQLVSLTRVDVPDVDLPSRYDEFLDTRSTKTHSLWLRVLSNLNTCAFEALRIRQNYSLEVYVACLHRGTSCRYMHDSFSDLYCTDR